MHGSAIKYADDLILVHPTNTIDDEADLQRSIDKMATAMSEKSLKLNPAKCYFMTISESTIPYLLTSPPTAGGAALMHTNALEYLGVTLDPKLTWHSNTQKKIA